MNLKMRVRINSLENYKHIHLIGIGGVSMSAIAETLHTWGYKVTGSDTAQSDYTDKLVKMEGEILYYELESALFYPTFSDVNK